MHGPVVEEMLSIREHALRRNQPDGVHVALLHQSGWFMEWLEGPPAGVRAVMRRVALDPRHRGIRLVHLSRGGRCLPTPWSMAYKESRETSEDFETRVQALRATERQVVSRDPAAVWSWISLPWTGTPVATRLQRVMICSARGTRSFDIVSGLGQQHRLEVGHQRLAGARHHSRDVGASHVDLNVPESSMIRRVVAMARSGLEIGLTVALLSNYTHIVLDLSGDARFDLELMRLVASACGRLARRPVTVGVGPLDCDHGRFLKLAREAGLIYLNSNLAGQVDAQTVWAAAEAVLDFSLAPDSDWLPLQGRG